MQITNVLSFKRLIPIVSKNGQLEYNDEVEAIVCNIPGTDLGI